MKLFNLDLHISVISDVKHIFSKIYPNIEIINWSISGHNWVLNEQIDNVDIINENTWQNIDENMINKFNERYDDFLRQFDGFIVTHTPIFCLLFEKYKKPIFMVNSCRYEQPYCWKDEVKQWNLLNEKLLHLWNSKLLIPISNNKADQHYFKLGTTINSIHIPSLCTYTHSKYNPNKNKIILIGNNYCNHNILMEYVNLPNIICKEQALTPGYTWNEFYSYKGVIIFPYEVSTMTIFELYSANVPMFFPSKKLLKEMILNNYINFNGPYAKNKYPEHLDDALGTNWIDYWINKADYYDDDNMKYITFFDNANDLNEKLNKCNFNEISTKMYEWNKIRKHKIYDKWKTLIDSNLNDSETNNIAIVAIASRGSIYDSLINVYWIPFIKYVNKNYSNVKIYLIFGSNIDITPFECIKDNIMVCNTKDSLIPGILNKTIKSFEILLKENYDYIMRTNLSTFIVVDNLLKILKSFDKTNVYAGYIGYHYDTIFIAGCGFILSSDNVKYIVKNKNKLNILEPDDVAIGQLIKNRQEAPRFDIINHSYFLESEQLNQLCEQIKNNSHYHSRIKNHNRGVDIQVFKYCLRYFYKI